MADKCVILCADHRCKHNLPGSYYGTCHHPDHANLGVYGGIDRMYKETCPRKEAIPQNMVRGVSMPRIFRVSAKDIQADIEKFQHLKPSEKKVYLLGEWGSQKKEDTP